jgi:hypothetical protein
MKILVNLEESGTIQGNWTMDELRDVRSVAELKHDGENSSYLSKLNYKKIYHQLNTKEI